MSSSADCLKTASKQEICQRALEAQNYLPIHPEMIIKVIGISLALDESEDHLFRNKDIFQQADQPENEEEGEDEEVDPFNWLW